MEVYRLADLLEVVFSSILTLILPERTADKVKDENTRKSTKVLFTILFTLIYGATLTGIVFSLVLIPDVLWKIFAGVLIIFLLYCICLFYYRIFKHK